MERLTVKDSAGFWKIRGFTETLPAYWQACNRLAYYEDMEEQGRLFVPPVKIDQTVWFIRPFDKKEITETVVEKIVAKGKGLYMKLACNAMYETSCNSIGKTVFLTREEAEQALKGGAN